MAITTNFSNAILSLVNDLVSADKVLLANAVFESAFEIGKLADNHTVITGVRNGNIIPILSNSPQYDSFPYKNPSDCNIPVCDLDLGFTAKPWVMGMIACKIPICINNFSEDFLLFWNTNKRVFGDENLESALMQFVVSKFQKNLEAALWRVAFFGDTSISSADINYQLLRSSDGIFTQAEAMDGIKIVVSENVLGAGMTGEAVYAYLDNAYKKASVLPWFDTTTVRFEMTQAMASVLASWLNSLSDRSMYNCDCYSADGVTSQRTFSTNNVMTIFGIPIYVHKEFDGVISALNLGNPYRAILTANTNILIGTSELDQLPSFDIWYSKDDDMIYIKGGANVGAALVTNEYVYIGSESL
jgi:hypothetical protein